MGLVKDIISPIGLKVISGSEFLNNEITKMVLSQPGIEFTGYTDHFHPGRIQIMGTKESGFYNSLTEKQKEESLEFIFKNDVPCIIFSNSNDVPQLFIDKGNKYGVPILQSEKTATSLYVEAFTFLSQKLAPRDSVHGVLMNIKGSGILLTGESGIGKSEIALELIKKGHQLIADDRVDIFERGYGNIVGEAPDISKGFLEIRGIGIVDVIKMYGAGSYEEEVKIDLVIELRKYDVKEKYDRLGINNEKIKFFKTDINKLTLPVFAGRNISTLVEAAAIQFKLKELGYSSNEEFINRVNKKTRGE